MDPFAVKIFRDRGSANIASRLCHPKGLVLVSVRCAFASGTGTASMTLTSFRADIAETLATLLTIPAVGTGTDVFVPFSEQESNTGAWTVIPGEILQINWTNPNSGTMTWALEVRYQANA